MSKNTDLFAAFFRVGMLGFGGGPSAIPLYEQEAVKKYKWMTSDEFGDTLALANTMPGPLATKMAGYIGWRVNGLVGCLIAIFASVVPTVMLMIILLGVLQQYKNVAWVNGMSDAVVPVVGVMLAILTLDFLKKSRDSLGWLRAVIYTVISIVLMEVLGVHPAFLIVAILVLVFLPLKKEGGAK
ncbi:chromate transporter [Planococcus sp. CAU13]|uniref:chromate transporter n=1 Tax=Planococcus sp. CAU13 TaxID=1541197 RepID=UPI00052FF9D3|nr:chromate transporter [Planococcus sp. CAU13]